MTVLFMLGISGGEMLICLRPFLSKISVESVNPANSPQSEMSFPAFLQDDTIVPINVKTIG